MHGSMVGHSFSTKKSVLRALNAHARKNRGSMGIYESRTSPECSLNGCRTSKKNIPLNARAHECFVFVRALSQRCKKVTRERRRRERRKFWSFGDIEGHKNTQKRTRNTHAHIFEKVRPPHFSQKWRGRAPPIFENGGCDQPRNPPAPPHKWGGRGNTGTLLGAGAKKPSFH